MRLCRDTVPTAVSTHTDNKINAKELAYQKPTKPTYSPPVMLMSCPKQNINDEK